METAASIGEYLRAWRQRRRMSQLDLALDAEVSTKHLSFLETGRSAPSREMVLRLAERLDIPLRERNVLLVSAGFAPLFGERALDRPDMEAARRAIDLILSGHEPFPALAVDRHWTLISANAAAMRLLGNVAPHLLAAPANVLRISLHPDGLAARIVNYGEWRAHLLARLHRQIDVSADPVLIDLMRELAAYPKPPLDSRRAMPRREDGSGIVVALQLAVGDDVLSLFSTTTIFGTPLDITLSELALESFFPADAETGRRLQEMAAA
jgi:transcriptional regulator with XRE-family HTH domain